MSEALPWRDGNDFRLWQDGDRFFPRMLEVIGSARQFVFLEIYLVNSGVVASRFIAALTAACRRGVKVAVLLDDYGARGLNKADRRRLQEAGVELAFFNPLHMRQPRRYLLRDHRKLLIVDGTSVFVGGAGLSDEFDPPGNGAQRWRETMVEVRGPVISDWVEAFHASWRRTTQQPLQIAPPTPPEPVGTVRGRVALSAYFERREVRRAALTQIRHARERVWIATAYFVPARKLRRALRRAARRGVDVRLLLPGIHVDHPAVRHAGRRFYTRLLYNGVRIYEYQPRFLHAKTLLCDHWVSIGSSNMDRWNLRWNLEANQEIDDPAFAKAVQEMFENDFACSTQIHYHTWAQRTWYGRFLEWFWGLIDQALDRRLKGE